MSAYAGIHLGDGWTFEVGGDGHWLVISDSDRVANRVTVFAPSGEDGRVALLEALRDVADKLEAALMPETVAAGLEIIDEIASRVAAEASR